MLGIIVDLNIILICIWMVNIVIIFVVDLDGFCCYY